MQCFLTVCPNNFQKENVLVTEESLRLLFGTYGCVADASIKRAAVSCFLRIYLLLNPSFRIIEQKRMVMGLYTL